MPGLPTLRSLQVTPPADPPAPAGPGPTARTPDDAAALFNLAVALRRAGRLDAAVATHRRALAQRPDYAKAHFGLGNCLRELGLLPEAVASFERTLQIDPSHAKAALNLGNALQELGRLADAAHSYRRAITIRPDWAAPHFNLHALMVAAGQFPAATACLELALALEPGNAQLRFFLGLLLDCGGDTARAAALLAPLAQGPALGQAWLDAWRHLKTANHGWPPPMAGTSLQTFTLALQAARPDGLVLEFGVRHGKSIRQLASLVSGPVHGFDSFEGLPESWHHEPKGSYSTQGRLPDVPPQVSLHAGWFDTTLPAFLHAHDGPARLINIDCDLYSSTKTVLDGLAGRIGPGTVLVFDEYIGNLHWRQDEFKAFQEAVALYGWVFEYLCFSFATKQVAVRIVAGRRS
jgi:tetratricopeptide (TPR) repeat protein